MKDWNPFQDPDHPDWEGRLAYVIVAILALAVAAYLLHSWR